MQCPTKRHLEAANCVLKYLKGTLGKGIPIKKCRIRDIEGFANFNWARSTKVSKSMIGYGQKVWGNLVTWRSKIQSVVGRRSAKADFIAIV